MTKFFICRVPRNGQARLIDQSDASLGRRYHASMLRLRGEYGVQRLEIERWGSPTSATVEVRVNGVLESTTQLSQPRKGSPRRRTFWDEDVVQLWTVPLTPDQNTDGPAELRVHVQWGFDGYVIAAIDAEVVSEPAPVELALSGYGTVTGKMIGDHIAGIPGLTREQIEAEVVRYMTWFGVGDACSEPRNVQHWADQVEGNRARLAAAKP